VLSPRSNGLVPVIARQSATPHTSCTIDTRASDLQSKQRERITDLSGDQNLTELSHAPETKLSFATRFQSTL
jgi:hypothetical protein